MIVQPMSRKMNAGLLAVALVACALVIHPGSLSAQQQRPPQALGMEIPTPEGGAGWAGIGIADVSAEKAKELKLPSDEGALVTDIRDDSPAAKAGIKKGDVITEYNGQRIQGAIELRRLVRETPPGHTAKISLWRDGRSQTASFEIGAAPARPDDRTGQQFESRRAVPGPAPFEGGGPEQFRFRNMPRMPFGGNGMGNFGWMTAPPALGVSAQDLSGQLGDYFGVPGGEGVLVTNVPANSPGGKAGIKAGDVITQIDGERVRNLGELRDRLREKQREGKSVKLDISRKGLPVTLSVQLEKPPAPPDPFGDRDRAIPL